MTPSHNRRLRLLKLSLSVCLLAAASLACAACAPVRAGYIDQHRPPYYLGNGALAPEQPGASVELLREILASVGCPMLPVRLPSLRIRSALSGGALDVAPLIVHGKDEDDFALPRDAQGRPDRDKTLRSLTIVWVRAADKLPRDTDPADYFKGRRLGVTHGAPFVAEFRSGGIIVDEGALDTIRSFDKLMLKRLDGFAVALTAPGDMDAFVSARYGDDLVRLDKPLRSTYVWLAVNPDYYKANRDQVEAMWRWIASNGRARFDLLLKKYDIEM
jgi:hypothetical protein